MHIISKEKDSYDYLVGKWGVDKNITLDRTSFDNSFSKAICEMEHCKACYISPKSGVYIHHYLLKVGYKYFISDISDDEYITSVGDEALSKLSFYRLKTNFFLSKNGFGFLDQEEIYLAIYSYLSSLKKDKDSNQSNDGKIVSHGFDKKKSFRKMKR